MTLFHFGAVWALFQFTWSGLAVFFITYYISLSLGIGMAYHRLLTHRSYKTPKAVEYFLTICATLALEGGPLFWVATHRKHHQHSDTDHDPHTPQHGGFWAWVGFGIGIPLCPQLRELGAPLRGLNATVVLGHRPAHAPAMPRRFRSSRRENVLATIMIASCGCRHYSGVFGETFKERL